MICETPCSTQLFKDFPDIKNKTVKVMLYCKRSLEIPKELGALLKW